MSILPQIRVACTKDIENQLDFEPFPRTVSTLNQFKAAAQRKIGEHSYRLNPPSEHQYDRSMWGLQTLDAQPGQVPKLCAGAQAANQARRALAAPYVGSRAAWRA